MNATLRLYCTSPLYQECTSGVNKLATWPNFAHALYLLGTCLKSINYSRGNAYMYTNHTHILLNYREVVSICMRLPFALLSRATQQIICRMELS